MSIKTSLKWGYIPTEEQTELMIEKMSSMGYEHTVIIPSNDGCIVREWNNEQDANSYIEFVKTFEPAPESAEVIVEE